MSIVSGTTTNFKNYAAIIYKKIKEGLFLIRTTLSVIISVEN